MDSSIAQLRAGLVAAGFDGIETEPRPTEGRPNSFEQMLDEEYGPAPTHSADGVQEAGA